MIKIGSKITWDNLYNGKFTFTAICEEILTTETKKGIEKVYTFREIEKDRNRFTHTFKIKNKKWYEYNSYPSFSHDPEPGCESGGSWRVVSYPLTVPKIVK